jgi:hypothetical protein
MPAPEGVNVMGTLQLELGRSEGQELAAPKSEAFGPSTVNETCAVTVPAFVNVVEP